MTTLWGILPPTGQLAAPEFAQQATARLRPFGTHAEQQETDAALFLGRHHCTFPQIVKTPDGSVLAWDGRLDNREDLGLGSIASTPEAILHQWHHHPEPSTLGRLVGDWALALWDAPRRTLWLARDHCGARPLYYHRASDGAYYWASLVDLLLPCLSGPAAIHLPYLAGMFHWGPDPASSPYREVLAVPPAHAVAIREQHGTWQESIHGLWTPPTATLRYKRDADYEEHFRSLLHTAIRCRLGPGTWAFLSGGLDSSSIVCVASRLIAEDPRRLGPLETITQVYDSSPSGERHFVADVEHQTGVKSHFLHAGDGRLIPERSASAPCVPFFMDNFAGLAIEQEDLIGHGNNILCGVGGDQLLGNSQRADLVLASQLRDGRIADCLRDLPRWAVGLRRPLWRVVAEGLVTTAGWSKDRSSRREWPDWMTPQLTSALHSEEAISRIPSLRKWPRGLLATIAVTAQPSHRSWSGVAVTYPFLDRRLMEFLLRIPLDQLTRPGESRSLMRRALRGVVPEQVLRRRSKNLPTPALGHAVATQYPRLRKLLLNPQLAALELVQLKELEQALERARHGAEDFMGSLLLAIAIEEWLRQMVERRWLLLPFEREPRETDVWEAAPKHIQRKEVKTT